MKVRVLAAAKGGFPGHNHGRVGRGKQRPDHTPGAPSVVAYTHPFSTRPWVTHLRFPKTNVIKKLGLTQKYIFIGQDFLKILGILLRRSVILNFLKI